VVTVRVTIGMATGKMAELARGAEQRFAEMIKGERGLKFIPVIVEAKGPDNRYAVMRGGNRQIPVTVKERIDKVEFSKALDVFSQLE